VEIQPHPQPLEIGIEARHHTKEYKMNELYDTIEIGVNCNAMSTSLILPHDLVELESGLSKLLLFLLMIIVKL